MGGEVLDILGALNVTTMVFLRGRSARFYYRRDEGGMSRDWNDPL